MYSLFPYWYNKQRRYWRGQTNGKWSSFDLTHAFLSCTFSFVFVPLYCTFWLAKGVEYLGDSCYILDNNGGCVVGGGYMTTFAVYQCPAV